MRLCVCRMRMCVRLRRRRQVRLYTLNMAVDLPSAELLKLQADWLSDARARLLRNAEIGRRKSILDLGTGHGFVIPELKRRSSGLVIGMDRSLFPLSSFIADTPVVCGNARQLPFRNRTIDLVFGQNVLLWTGYIRDVIREVSRILTLQGSWVLLEPDYGGLMEYPHDFETREIWIQALTRAGADPVIGRKLPALLAEAGFMVRVEMLPHLLLPHPARFDFLQELPLTDDEKRILNEIRNESSELNPSYQVAHLPYFLIIADHY